LRFGRPPGAWPDVILSLAASAGAMATPSTLPAGGYESVECALRVTFSDTSNAQALSHALLRSPQDVARSVLDTIGIQYRQTACATRRPADTSMTGACRQCGRRTGSRRRRGAWEPERLGRAREEDERSNWQSGRVAA
jgi:hypothetical protein